MAKIASHPLDSTQPDLFSFLPTELRFSILAHILTHPSRIEVSNFVSDRIAYRLFARRRLLSLTPVSRQLRADAITVFASLNVFEVTSGASLTHFLRTLGAIGRANLIHLHLVFPAAVGLIDARELNQAIPVLRAECGMVRVVVRLHAGFLRSKGCISTSSSLIGYNGPSRPTQVVRKWDSLSQTPNAGLLRELARLKEASVEWADEGSEGDETSLVQWKREAEVWLAGD